MNKPVVITARIDEDTSTALDRLAIDLDRSRSWLIAEALKDFVRREIELSDLLREGEAAAERGEVLTHEEFIAEMSARYGRKQAA